LQPLLPTPRPRPQLLREYAAPHRRVQELRRGTNPSDEADQLTGPAEAYAEILGEPFDAASIDFLNPDYSAILTRRAEARARLQERIELLPALKRYYADRPAQFITDWGLTYDPRNADIGLPTTVPLFYSRARSSGSNLSSTIGTTAAAASRRNRARLASLGSRSA
jgi:hypothetical protein